MNPKNAVFCASIAGILAASVSGCLDLKTTNTGTTGGQGGSAGSGQGGGGAEQASSSSSGGGSSSSGGGSSNSSSSSSSSGGACAPEGSMMSCYPGPAATRGRGACADGNITCQGGNWSACMGFVIPTREACDSSVDTNCDGRKGCSGVPAGGGTIGTNEDDAIVAIAAAAGANGNDGNVYGTGYRNAVVMPDGQPDSAQVLFVKRDPSGTLTDWSNQFDIVTTGSAWGRGLAINPKNEDIAIVGTYENGSLNIGGQGLPATGTATFGFLAAFNAAGVSRFSKSFGSGGITFVNDVTVDNVGNIYIGGKFNATIDFGGPTAVAIDGFDAFMASYTSTGTLRWKHVFAGSGDQSVEGLTVDSGGNVYAATQFDGQVTIMMNLTLAPDGANDAVITAHDANAGTYLWANHIGGTGDLAVTDICAGAGTVAMVAAFRGNVYIGGSGNTSIDSPPSWDTVVAVLESSGGAAMASYPFISDGTQVGLGVAVDSFGDIVVDGYFSTSLPLSGGLMDPTSGDGDTNAFVVKFDSMLVPRWGHGYGNSLIQAFTDVALDPSTDHLFLGGGFQGILLGFGVNVPTSTGGFDALIGVMSN